MLTLAAASPTVAPERRWLSPGRSGFERCPDRRRADRDPAAQPRPRSDARHRRHRGRWHLEREPARARARLVLRALHPVSPAAASNVIGVGVTPVLTLTLVSQPPVRLAGTVLPPKRLVTLDTYRVVDGGRRLIQRQQYVLGGGAAGAWTRTYC